MTPELLAKIEELVKTGATVVGAPPRKSPSLVNYPSCDQQVARQAEMLWGSLESPVVQTERSFGKGRIVWGGGPELYPPYDQTAAILSQMRVAPDFESAGPVRYTHRSMDQREIYFVANRSGEPVQTSAAFRVSKGAPELWNPISGTVRPLPQFSRTNGLTSIPLHLEAYESYFVVFPNHPSAASQVDQAAENFPVAKELATLEGSWEVTFDVTMGAPARVTFDKLEDWTARPEVGVKYYSGIATYTKTFKITQSLIAAMHTPLFLDLGELQVMARVRVNGTNCGVVWTAPWRVDISQAVHAGDNQLEIEVANLWPNRMIGDAISPEKAYTQTTYRPYKAGDPLLPSGLLGPVRLLK